MHDKTNAGAVSQGAQKNLFRGKERDDGSWHFGWYCRYPFGRWPLKDAIIPADDAENGYHHFVEVDGSTVGQFAGLYDKNGNCIFEGDICKFKEWQHGEFCWVGVVKFEHCQFLISGGPNKECETPFTLCLSRFSAEQLEIIGNIHDNPELFGAAK